MPVFSLQPAQLCRLAPKPHTFGFLFADSCKHTITYKMCWSLEGRLVFAAQNHCVSGFGFTGCLCMHHKSILHS